MARIAGVDLPRNKRIDIALTYIFGIGRTNAKKIVDEANVESSTKAQDLTESDISNLRNIIDQNHKVEGELRREREMDIRRLREIRSYRGLRHQLSLPVRGQRTRTNARTRKGKARTISVGRKAKEAARRGG